MTYECSKCLGWVHNTNIFLNSRGVTITGAPGAGAPPVIFDLYKVRSRDCLLMASYQPKISYFLAKPCQARSHNVGNLANNMILIDSSEESNTQGPDAVAAQCDCHIVISILPPRPIAAQFTYHLSTHCLKCLGTPLNRIPMMDFVLCMFLCFL